MEAWVSSFFFPSDLLPLTTLAFVVNLSSIFGLWVGEILPVSFGDLCPEDTIYPVGLTQFFTLWPWGVFQGLYACYGFPECGLGAFDGLLSVALSSWILFFPGVPLCLLPKQQSTLLEFIFGLCLHDCLLSVRQGYLGELCWPFSWMIFSLEGFFLHWYFYFSHGLPYCSWFWVGAYFGRRMFLS